MRPAYQLSHSGGLWLLEEGRHLVGECLGLLEERAVSGVLEDGEATCGNSCHQLVCAGERRLRAVSPHDYQGGGPHFGEPVVIVRFADGL